jgi:two-component system cell cycle sensor histidine kinase/response regulator CckA
MQRSDGSTGPVPSEPRRGKDADGVRPRVLADSAALEAELREAQDLFETAFAQAPIGMALIGTDGHWLKVNTALCAITGWSEAELLQRSFREITHA